MVSEREQIRCERALEHLQDAKDKAVAATTIPRERDGQHWIAPIRVKPAVDPSLWLRHVHYARHGDGASLDELVDHYLPHAKAEARRHYRHGEPLEDLTQVALEALMLALKRFDPTRRRPFLAFAKPTMSGMIRRHFRDSGWSIRVPRHVHELAGPIRETRELLTHDLGRHPNSAEVADFLDINESEVLNVMTAEEARRPNSLDVVDPTTRRRTEEVIGRPDTALSSVENRTALRQSLKTLPEADKDLLKHYFVEEETQSQIAERLGCSQMQVSRLLTRAICRLRRDIVGG